MAFTWPGKKETREQHGARPEFPTDLHVDLGGSPSAEDADALSALTKRLENLSKLVDEAKEQVTSYLLHRESLSAGEDVSAIAGRFEALSEKLDQLSGNAGRNIEQKLDALYGKIDSLSQSGAVVRDAKTPDGTSAASNASAQGAMAEKIEHIDAKLEMVEALKESLIAQLGKLRDSQTEQHGALNAGVRQIAEMVPQYFGALPQYFNALQQQILGLQQHADSGLRAIIDILKPPQKESAEPASVPGDWQEAMLGRDLASSAAIKQERQQLLRGVLAGDPGASALVGNLMLFRAAPAEKMPPLLKEIGEAYYRWQPRSTNRPAEFEQALIAWLQRACEQAGMANTIELVHPGERFDSLRHNASRPGVEITQVLGWIVLRDNGKVYTKASVAVK